MLSCLESELREQGRVLAARTEPGWQYASAAAALLGRDVDHLVIAARGTSDNAARYAQYLFGMQARLAVGLAAPWLYSRRAPPLLTRGAALAISQSGRSPDVVSVLEAAREQRRPAIAITNELDSPLAAAADVVVPMIAGEERSVAATKTYLASLHAVAQIAACLRGGAGSTAWFERLPGLVAAAVDEQLTERARFDPLADCSLVTVVGRGLQFPTAHETALKIRELSGLPAEAFSPPDLMHGPIAALRPSGALWTVGAVEPIPFDGFTIAVPPRAGIPEWVAPFLCVIPGQVAALRLGELRGVDLDRPHGLSKVTLTR